MGTLYVQTTGSADNSGSTDQNAADLSGAAATVAGAVVTLDGSPDLSTLSISGSTQSTINIAGATNSNQTIFWITAFDNVLKTVTVTPSPTGVVSNAWKIGGRHLLTSARIEGALRAGDTAIFNDSPAAANAVIWTFRNAGDNASGFAKIMGKSGARPVFNSTGTTNVISTNVALSWMENIDADQDGATGSPINLGASAAGAVVYNIKVVDGGGDGVTMAGAGQRLIGCSVAGCGASAVNVSGAGPVIILGNYLRNGSGTNGITLSSNSINSIIVGNIIAAAPGRGIIFSGAQASAAFVNVIYGNTIYGCGNSGLEVTDADTPITLLNNIFMNNGNAANEANVEWVAGTGEVVSIHGYNFLFNGSGADAPINFTANAQIPGTEFTSDPQFVNAGAGDFALGPASPARGVGFQGVFPGGASVGHLSDGAAQPTGQGVTFADSALRIRR